MLSAIMLSVIILNVFVLSVVVPHVVTSLREGSKLIQLVKVKHPRLV